MTKHIAFIVVEDFADWEHGLLSAAMRSYFGGTTAFHTPGGGEVTSNGGLTINPQGSIEALDPAGYDALVVIGSSVWDQPQAPDVSAQLQAALDAGKVVGAICGATVAAARAGVLEGRAHTSNGPDYLMSNAARYCGHDRYVETPRAVRDGLVVTAPGSAPATFATGVLAALYPERAEAVADFEALCAIEHRA